MEDLESFVKSSRKKKIKNKKEPSWYASLRKARDQAEKDFDFLNKKTRKKIIEEEEAEQDIKEWK